jgi:hypothetical protein
VLHATSRRFSGVGLSRKARLAKDPACAFPSIERELASLLPFHFHLLKLSHLPHPRRTDQSGNSLLQHLSFPLDHQTHKFTIASFRSQQPTQHFRPAPPREPTATATAKTHLRKVLPPSCISPSTSLPQAHLTPSFRDRTRQNVRHWITPTEARGRRAPEH